VDAAHFVLVNTYFSSKSTQRRRKQLIHLGRWLEPGDNFQATQPDDPPSDSDHPGVAAPAEESLDTSRNTPVAPDRQDESLDRPSGFSPPTPDGSGPPVRSPDPPSWRFGRGRVVPGTRDKVPTPPGVPVFRMDGGDKKVEVPILEDTDDDMLPLIADSDE